jgi:hypothetical protein
MAPIVSERFARAALAIGVLVLLVPVGDAMAQAASVKTVKLRDGTTITYERQTKLTLVTVRKQGKPSKVSCVCVDGDSADLECREAQRGQCTCGADRKPKLTCQ